MINSIRVKVNEVVAGSLVLENSDYVFSYDKECVEGCLKDETHHQISLTMPIRTRSYVNEISLHPIFEMHLPEGYLLSVIKKHFSKLKKLDDFGLLELMAPNIKGRIGYDALNKMVASKPKEVDEHILLQDLLSPSDELLFSDLVARFALSSGLSGVQPKVLARVLDKVTLSLTDYIVKSWGEDYPQLALNEYYCMLITKCAGVPVPEFYLSDDDKLFIMKRFDVTEDKKYLGFEDMCVLQGKSCDDKYESTYEKVATTIKTFVSMKHKHSALLNFFKILVINNLVKNGDAHLKNFGVLYSDFKDIKLAPAYDIVCTTAYIKNDIPALLMQGSKKWFEQKALLNFGVTVCDLSAKQASIAYKECVSAVKVVLVKISVFEQGINLLN